MQFNIKSIVNEKYIIQTSVKEVLELLENLIDYDTKVVVHDYFLDEFEVYLYRVNDINFFWCPTLPIVINLGKHWYSDISVCDTFIGLLPYELLETDKKKFFGINVIYETKECKFETFPICSFLCEFIKVYGDINNKHSQPDRHRISNNGDGKWNYSYYYSSYKTSSNIHSALIRVGKFEYCRYFGSQLLMKINITVNDNQMNNLRILIELIKTVRWTLP